MIGPIMMDLRGTSIDPEERERLLHPSVGGVILFTRNYESQEQLQDLVAGLHALREPRLLVAVDHEGGRVQRFREGYTRLPACRLLGGLYDRDPAGASGFAEDLGWLMATELRAAGIDFSFAPVLDLDWGRSAVIGDRAFHSSAEAVAQLGRSYMRGMQSAGMPAVGKHFPGHGYAEADSHHALPLDERDYADLDLADLVPFRRLIDAGLPAIMPAHVVYPRVDSLPAGFSRIWLRDVLRGRLGFQGAVFSDDVDMAGAAVAGDHLERVHAALAAGCDMVLVCNNPDAVARVLDGLSLDREPASQARLIPMHGRRSPSEDFRADPRWRQACDAIAALEGGEQLALGDGLV